MSYTEPVDCPVCGTILVESEMAGRYCTCRACDSVHDLTEVTA
jgi:hypothetical protein